VGVGCFLVLLCMASAAYFSLIGDALPSEQRAIGFSLQSILKRVPIVIAPLVGGLIIARHGIIPGVHLGLIVTLAIAVVTALLIRFINITHASHHAINIFGVWKSFQISLKRLLVSDIFIRTCEGMTDVLVILYVT